MEVGATLALSATVAPSDSTDKSVTWVSSDASVATVTSSGSVKAIKAGTTKITVTTTDGGKVANCDITVTAVVPEG